MPEWKRAWVKLGLACLRHLMNDVGPGRVKDSRTMDPAVLRKYGQPELIKEFGAVLHH